MGTILGRNLKSTGFLMHKVTRHHRYILTQTEDIPQKHITSIRKEIDYQKRNLLSPITRPGLPIFFHTL